MDMDKLKHKDLITEEVDEIKVVIRPTGTSFPAFTAEARGVFKCMGGLFNHRVNSWIINLNNPQYPFSEDKDMKVLKYLIKISKRVYKNGIEVEVYKGKRRIRQLSKEIEEEETGFVKRERL